MDFWGRTGQEDDDTSMYRDDYQADVGRDLCEWAMRYRISRSSQKYIDFDQRYCRPTVSVDYLFDFFGKNFGIAPAQIKRMGLKSLTHFWNQ